MAKSKGKSKLGRPRIPIITEDLGKNGLAGKLPSKPIVLEEVLYWMQLQATAEEIAGSFYVSVDTLVTRLKEATGLSFSELKEKACGLGKLALRKNQFSLSKTNASMAIWLGKNWLDQSDDPKRDDEAIREREMERKKELIDYELTKKHSLDITKGVSPNDDKLDKLIESLSSLKNKE